MQKVTILCVGKLKEKFYADAVAEYTKRLGRFCKLDIVELAEERLPEDPSPAQIGAALAKAAAALRGKLPASACGALRAPGRLVQPGGTQPGLSDRRLLRPCPLPQGPGVGQAVHVPHDLSPPSGPCHAFGANLPGVPDQRGEQVS